MTVPPLTVSDILATHHRRRKPFLRLAQKAARAFVRSEAGFAQVTTLDRSGIPVARSMTAFLQDDWSVHLIQRNVHSRIAQWRRDPRTQVTWVGPPAANNSNEAPHVFDVGPLPPRAVFVRGVVEFTDEEWTVRHYTKLLTAQRARGFTRAPVRNRDEVIADLVGTRLEPTRVRLEGFGEEAESFQLANRLRRIMT